MSLASFEGKVDFIMLYNGANTVIVRIFMVFVFHSIEAGFEKYEFSHGGFNGDGQADDIYQGIMPIGIRLT